MTNHLLSSKKIFSGNEKMQAGRVHLPFKERCIIVVIGSIFFSLFYFLQFYLGSYTSISEWGLSLLLYAVETLCFFIILLRSVRSLSLCYAVLVVFLFAIALELPRISGLPFWPVHLATNWLNIVLIGYFASFSVYMLRRYNCMCGQIKECV